ncbi:mas-related G-protein coupled receptor member X1-like [Sorex araneus]|uniref:mas-related G-protein coupled receptor member X1-like n=1 Tax=Sorex araneus TaxID=42254 RepID=UPI0024335970|nr:mas-related G-protein coupled receptor member X1-like [Sorex araneus]
MGKNYLKLSDKGETSRIKEIMHFSTTCIELENIMQMKHRAISETIHKNRKRDIYFVEKYRLRQGLDLMTYPQSGHDTKDIVLTFDSRSLNSNSQKNLRNLVSVLLTNFHSSEGSFVGQRRVQNRGESLQTLPVNRTQLAIKRKNAKQLIFSLVKIIISLVGLAGNAVVLWLLAFRMQRNAFSVYILNLAGADFVFLSIHMIFSILAVVGYSRLDSHNVFQVCIIMFVFPYHVGLSILTAISTEHCLSVLKPIWYRCHRLKHMSSVMCVLLRALALLLIILDLVFCGLWFGYTNEYFCMLTGFSIVTWPIFSFGLLFGSSLVLLIRLLCGSRKMKLTRLYMTIALTLLVFLLYALPWGKVRFSYTGLLRLLTCVNSSANPIIYFFVGSFRQQRRQQRRSFKVVLQRVLQDVPEEDGSQGSPPQETLEMSGNTHVV